MQVDMLCLARAIAGKPRLLLVDGILDSLSDDEVDAAISSLLHADRPWTLVIGTGRQSIANRFDQVIRLETKNRLLNEQEPEGVSS
jgi:putative ABC transport system ATP-binding protein